MEDKPIGGSKLIEFVVTYGWVFLIVLVAMGALAYFDNLREKTQNVKYCLEWDDWITREDLWHNCIDFKNLAATCNYNIEDDSTLSVYVPEDGNMTFFESYNCTKYITAKEVIK